MLYSDPAFTAERLIFEGGAPSDLEITDEYDVIHRVWKLTDPHLINLSVTSMADKKLIIADGHHRYETSVTYMHERAAELGFDKPAAETEEEEESPSNRADEPHSLLPKPPFPEAAMMMTFVNMDAPGITILPTHRVVFGLKDFSTEAFLKAAEAYFTVTSLPAAETGALAATQGVAFLAATKDQAHLLTAKPEAVLARLKELHPEITARQAQLDVVQLHRLVLEHLLKLTHESIANLENIRYIRGAEEAVEQVQSGRADVAFLIKPVTLTQLRDISLSNDVMPQKSTDFYPKLLSGLAIYALD